MVSQSSNHQGRHVSAPTGQKSRLELDTGSAKSTAIVNLTYPTAVWEDGRLRLLGPDF